MHISPKKRKRYLKVMIASTKHKIENNTNVGAFLGFTWLDDRKLLKSAKYLPQPVMTSTVIEPNSEFQRDGFSFEVGERWNASRCS